VRVNRGVGLLVYVLLLAVSLSVAQSPNGTISGIVLDPSGGVIVGANVLIINNATGVEYPGKANSEGYYVVPNIPPGSYRIQVSNSGFKTIIKPDIVLHVEDALAINFTLPIGAASEIVTVEGGAPLINTTDASVGTVVDHAFVENMPLNGRSFQDLILLTPGVVANSPQGQLSSGVGVSGEFSVNGQRTESNYYTVDGVSGNTGAFFGGLYYPSASGSVPASTALGTTQSLVSVDSLQEFRVQSSTYSAEYGRNPGGQISFATRSGTNQWHGTASEYLRNSIFDANDWFNNYYGQPEPGLRQNDFGGTVGGPIQIPNVYDGKDKTFFFFSYEGLRLLQPQASSVSYVPDGALRKSAAVSMQPIVDALPVANGPDLGGGAAEFIGTWSNPSHIDAYSVRLDHAIADKLRLFFRFSDTESASGQRSVSAPSFAGAFELDSRTYTAGVTGSLLRGLSNDLRLNYSTADVKAESDVDSFGGAVPVDFRALSGSPSNLDFRTLVFFDSGYSSLLSVLADPGAQRQWNLVDSVSATHGRHTLKGGVDWRRLSPSAKTAPTLIYFLTTDDLIAGTVSSLSAHNYLPNYAIYQNVSLFAQDEWHATSRLNVSLGVRWDVNPAPGASHGILPYTVEGTIPDTLKLAPYGTPLWNTDWYNFAPRLGAAYLLRQSSSYETVLRGGVGVFYDTGQQAGGAAFQGPGLSGTNFYSSFFSPVTFPAQAVDVIPTIVPPTQPLPPSTSVYGYERNLKAPYTWETNLSVQQALGTQQTITVSYVGGFGRKLIRQNQIELQDSPNFCMAPCYLFLVQNGLSSNYNALQTQFQRRLAGGLAVLASYTLSHSIDYGSNNVEIPYVRGNSDFDVRHVLSAAFSYDLSHQFDQPFARILLNDWGLDDRFTARTGYPVTINGAQIYDPATGQITPLGLDIVPGQPLYLYGSHCDSVLQSLQDLAPGQGCPGGRAINPTAFTLPPGCSNVSTCTSSVPGNAPRNFVRGFGAWQMDLAVRREFPVHERVRLQFRAEAFNIFNHPSFGQINSFYGQNTFGQATATLANSPGVLSPLYQMGGARSLQLALKLMF
jgi:hypothetical protein